MKSVLSTAELSESKRFDFWQGAVCDTFVQLDCRRLSRRPFNGMLVTIDVADYRFSSVSSRDHQVTRTAQRIRQGREETLLVSAMLTGSGIYAQDGREATLQAGDFVCYDSTRPYSLRFDADFEQVVLQVPREFVTQHVGRTELITARPVQGSSAMGKLVFPFLKQMASMTASFEPVTMQRLSNLTLALLTTAFGELVCTDASQSCGRTALVYRAKSYIDENVHDFALNTEKVARHLHISERYLQDLFHAESTTVSDWIWSRRLERCKRMLSDALRNRESISQIATAAGFGDFGHFSRRFKAASRLPARGDRIRLAL